MDNKNVISIIFIEAYNSFFQRKPIFDEAEQGLLEEVLFEYLSLILDKKILYNYSKKYAEINESFKSIFYNYDGKTPIISFIKDYTEKLKKIFNDNKYLTIFFNVMRKNYSSDYSGTFNFDRDSYENDSVIINNGKTFRIGRYIREEQVLPSIIINDYEVFNSTLETFIETVKNTNIYYNVFNDNYESYSDEKKIEYLLENVMYNASNEDLLKIESLFIKFNEYFQDDTFKNITSPTKIIDIFSDELYVKQKNALIGYETPYCLSYMLKNHVLELSIIRMGIDKNKCAHIYAIQDSQRQQNYNRLSDIQTQIKRLIPKSPSFRYFNPAHLFSLLLTLGLLKGVGIEDVFVNDYMPFRYNKMVYDRNLSDDEAYNFQKRMTEKRIFTFMKLIEISEGLEIINYPGDGTTMHFKIGNFKIESNELQELYNSAYELGVRIKEEKTISLS